ncbi:MAG: methyltransferase domain-containing protein [Deltaproteobacteria bacterium]|nr:methyltransferase domain-containing protein [Deltaproteobacteria bacterium]
MKRRLLDWLACPACGEGDLHLESRRSEWRKAFAGHWEPDEVVPGLEDGKVEEIIEGELRCPGCGAKYPIVDSIPRMLGPGSEAGPSTGHRWTQFENAVPEFEKNFLDIAQPLEPGDFMGRLVLDAGCGFGRHALFATRYGAEVVALDSSPEAVASCLANLGEGVRGHVVQGDIDRPPLKRGIFDLVFSYGVLHHVPNARATFAMLGELVKPNGRLSIWVYGPRQGTTRIVTGALRGATAAMRPEQLHRFSQVVASGLRVFSHTPYRFLSPVPPFGWVLSHLPLHDHHRWPFDVVVADIYDRLRVPVTGYFTGEEIEGWYAEAGYADIKVSRRLTNTESFRGLGTRR